MQILDFCEFICQCINFCTITTHTIYVWIAHYSHSNACNLNSMQRLYIKKQCKFIMNIDCMNCAIFEYQNTQFKCYDECVIAINIATTLLTQCFCFN
jgi:hypothetical protein